MCTCKNMTLLPWFCICRCLTYVYRHHSVREILLPILRLRTYLILLLWAMFVDGYSGGVSSLRRRKLWDRQRHTMEIFISLYFPQFTFSLRWRPRNTIISSFPRFLHNFSITLFPWGAACETLSSSTIPRFPPFLRDQPRGLWLCSFPRFPHIWPISSFPRDPTQCYMIRLISWFPHNSPFPRDPTYRFITLISPFSRAPSRRSISSMSSYFPIYNRGHPSADFPKFPWLPHFSRPHPETLT